MQNIINRFHEENQAKLSTRNIFIESDERWLLLQIKKNPMLSTRKLAELILQAFRRITYVTVHSPTLPSLYVHHSSFSNPSVVSPTSQHILQTFFRFFQVTGSSLTSPGERPKVRWGKRQAKILKSDFCFLYIYLCMLERFLFAKIENYRNILCYTFINAFRPFLLINQNQTCSEMIVHEII